MERNKYNYPLWKTLGIKKNKVRTGRLKNVIYKYLKFPNFGYVY